MTHEATSSPAAGRQSSDAPRAAARLTESVAGYLLMALLLARTLLSETFVVMDVDFLGGSAGPSPAITAWLDLLILGASTLLLLGYLTERVSFTVISGFGLLFAGVVVSSWGAGDALAARLAGANLFIALLAAGTLAYFFHKPHRRRIALAGVIAVTSASAYRCVSQVYYEFPSTIEAWKEQKKQLIARGMRQDDPMIENYERRMHSLEAYGYHYHPNIAGSMLMAGWIALGAVLGGAWLSRSAAPASAGKDAAPEATGGIALLLGAAVWSAAAYAIWLTGSNGAIGSALVGVVLLAALFLRGNALASHPRRSATILLGGYFAVIAAGALFGTLRGTLPGSSLAFRWEYWTTAMRAFLDAPLTGIGRENFLDAYCKFKSAAGVEEVRDPHNLWVSLLVELGPFGLVAGMLLFGSWIRAALIRSADSARAAHGRIESTQAAASRPVGGHASLIAGAKLVALLTLALAIQLVASGAPLRDPNLRLLWMFETAGVTLCGGVIGWSLLGWAMGGERGMLLLNAGVIAACAAMLIHSLVDYALLTPAGIALFAMLVAAAMPAGATTRFSFSSASGKIQRAVLCSSLVGVLGLHQLSINLAISDGIATRHLNDFVLKAASADEAAHFLNGMTTARESLGPGVYARSMRVAVQLVQSGQLSVPTEHEMELMLEQLARRPDGNPKNADTWELRAQIFTELANRPYQSRLGTAHEKLLADAFHAIRQAVSCNPTNPRLRIRAAEAIVKLSDPLESNQPRLADAAAIPFADECLREALRINDLRPPQEVMQLRESELQRIANCRHDLESLTKPVEIHRP